MSEQKWRKTQPFTGGEGFRSKNRVQLAVRFKPETFEKIRKMAESENVTIASVVAGMCDEMFEVEA